MWLGANIRICAAVLGLLLLCPPAAADADCVNDYLNNGGQLGFAPNDVEEVIQDVASAFGLAATGITALPCDGIPNVEAIYFDGAKAPLGDYILYDRQWVRQSIGFKFADPAHLVQRDKAWVLFAHELGHIFLRHFTTGINLSRLEKETQADHFAGCAAGAMGASWVNVEEFFENQRGDVDGYYPSREHSIATAKEAFDRCSGRAAQKAPVTPQYLAERLRQALLKDDAAIDVAALETQALLFSANVSLDDSIPIVDSLTEATRLDVLRKMPDVTRKDLWGALSGVKGEYWTASDAWIERERLVKQNMAAFERFSTFDNITRSEEMKTAFALLASKINYGVPPGRLVSVAPFRMHMAYCAATKCDIELILRGYDDRGKLRLDLLQKFDAVWTSVFIDTTLNSNYKLYFEFGQQSDSVRPLSLKLYCRFHGEIIEGQQVSVSWSAADEVTGSYSTWVTCKNDSIEASLGLSVAQAMQRLDEPAVLPDPGPPSSYKSGDLVDVGEAPSDPNVPLPNEDSVLFKGTRVRYSGETHEEGDVKGALEQLGINYEHMKPENSLPTNLLLCTEDVPVGQIRALALQLIFNGVNLKDIEPQPGSRRVSLVGRENVWVYGNLNEAEIAKIDRCRHIKSSDQAPYR
ncbi:hypothetical protein C1D09_000770 [Mesorhizobium intechi]|uniref:ImmA/IrrE family metallo-endopeptidase n=1 Tax=Mesorhizobium intechi TaxID=537601 RepID=UPI000CB0E027|nr:hypothetical protein [Mesorhizobium intechi]TSE14054.1 hypothetical protein C1D09_000770 [Mesorhizobium intechi]